ncbi:MAG: hypothetical protein HC822_03605 [Oscillochloris sp.]|nr:hypothetical protein [Oscillochloris sp.]
MDRWTVIGRRVEQEDRLTVQRTWLWAERLGRPALLLDFAVPGGTLERALTPGLSVEAELVFYPGAVRLRGLLKERRGPFENPAHLPGFTIRDATAGYADALGRNPWLERWPLLIAPVTLTVIEQRWYVQDADGRVMRLAPHFSAGWRLLAIGGGQPFTLIGEWDGIYLMPLSAQFGERLITFGAG